MLSRKNLYVYPCRLIRVIDGDTFELELDLGLQIKFQQKFRLWGIDVYERHTEEGKAATQFCEDWFRGSGILFAETIKDKQGKYGRYLVRIYDQFDEELNEVLKINKFEK